ncbi:MAG: hypothetical protein RTV41_03835 [Candidatus Thorarchaeota archaeon]
MPRLSRISVSIIFLVTFLFTPVFAVSDQDSGFTAAAWAGGLIIDHNCIDLNSIPGEWIDAAQDDVITHYAHTSHGGQITTGLTRLESANATFDCSIGGGTLPTDSGALCILDGNPPHSYITPDLYWQGADARVITQNTIDSNPTLTVSLWSWCTQLNSYDTVGTQEYLDAMTMLETANPGITFIYMTSNAQASGSTGYNRWVNNEMVRQYCSDNDKILFDFADLDCWSGGIYSTYQYDDGDTIHTVPVEHPDFVGDEAGHTTYTSCEQKGRAFWWMMAMLAGWNAPDPTQTITSTTTPGQTTSPTLPTPLDLFILVTTTAVIMVGVVIIYVKRK